tara:strand:+ start:28 stop:261 length:234 start_codon:yes stop_codon:yes gene_type:complete
MKPDDELITTGLLCPLPVLKLRKKMQQLKKGLVIKIFSDDPAAEIDIPYYCKEQNHQILKKIKQKSKFGVTFYIKKC